MASFLSELIRRNVFRNAALYLAAAWLILQVADLVFAAFDVPPAAMRVLIVIFAVGLPVLVVLSWFYEVTGAGLVKDTGHSTDATRRKSSRATNIIIVAILIAAAGIYAYSSMLATTEPSVADPVRPAAADTGTAIVVLPLANTSSDAGDEYLANGLTEELINNLTMIPQLSVTARASSFAFKDTAKDAPTIGKELAVDYMLEGSVRKDGEKLRISVRLVGTDTGRTVWAATYDREFRDIFEIQKDIAERVSGTLQLSLFSDPMPIVRRTTADTYSAYLRGLFQYRTFSQAGLAEAVAALEKAIALDPDYAPARTLLATVRINQAIIGEIDYAEGFEMARSNVEHALDLDPNYAFAISSRAWIAMSYERDFHAAARYFRRALELAPNDAALLSNLAVLARRLGRPDRAIELTNRSIALNPLSAAAFNNLSDQLYQARRFSEATEAVERALELAPGSPSAIVNLAVCQIFAENPEGALQTVQSVEIPFYVSFVAALANADLGRQALADAALATLTEQYADQRAVYIAAVHARRGQRDEAFRWLQRAIDERQRTLAMRTEPLFANLHDDPRWPRILEQLGLSDQQLSDIEI
jgi:TolB-like protein/Tfp pilus assembly protein PilF